MEFQLARFSSVLMPAEKCSLAEKIQMALRVFDETLLSWERFRGVSR